MNGFKNLARRLSYFAIGLIWLLILLFPLVAFRLAAAGEIVLGSDPGRQMRVFLIQEPDAEGIGIERIRPVATTESVQLRETVLTYLMWAGKGENTRFCQQFDRTSGAFLGSQAGACP